jgi:hypothetical protein
MGAWMIGWSIFKRSSNLLFGQLGAAGGGVPCARAPFGASRLAAPPIDKATPLIAAAFKSFRRSMQPIFRKSIFIISFQWWQG